MLTNKELINKRVQQVIEPIVVRGEETAVIIQREGEAMELRQDQNEQKDIIPEQQTATVKLSIIGD